MAGHIQDRWYKTETSPEGKAVRVKTERYGTGLRYRARFVGPDGTEKSKSFRDGQKRLAEKWLNKIETDMGSGQYVDPSTAKKTFQQYTEKWLSTLGADPNTIESMKSQLGLHAFPYIGSRPLGSFKPEHIREWVAVLEAKVPGSYGRIIYANVRAALSAAVDDGYLSRNPVSARSVKPPKLDPKRVVPWSAERVFAVQDALPDRYRAMVDLGAGCGMRRGDPRYCRGCCRLRVRHASRGPTAEAQPEQARIRPSQGWQDAGYPSSRTRRGSAQGPLEAFPAS